MTKKLITGVHPPGDSLPDDDPSRSLLQYTSLTAYFHEQLGQVRQSQNFDATEVSEIYVLNLLETFAQPDQLFIVDESGRRQSEALAMILHGAVFGNPADQVHHYKRLGDLALFISGFFSDSLKRRSVGVSYYIDMGQAAYATLAGLIRGSASGVFRDLYQELAESFSGWVEVLCQLSEQLGLTRRLHELADIELFERWGRLDGPQRRRLADTMLARGMMPLLIR